MIKFNSFFDMIEMENDVLATQANIRDFFFKFTLQTTLNLTELLSMFHLTELTELTLINAW